MNKKFLLAFLLALLLDGVDYTIGWIPIAGDVIDLVGIIILLPLIGAYALFGIGEFVPLIDFLPVFTGAVLMAMLASRMKQGGAGGA